MCSPRSAVPSDRCLDLLGQVALGNCARIQIEHQRSCGGSVAIDVSTLSQYTRDHEPAGQTDDRGTRLRER